MKYILLFISIVYSFCAYSQPAPYPATTSVLGSVKPDGTTITASGGVLSAVGGGILSLSPTHIFMGNLSGSAVDTIFANDINTLPEYRVYHFAKGITANDSVTGRGPTYLDSNIYYYTTAAGSGKLGGWLANGTSGDSIQVTAPFWVVFGDSQAEGYPSKHGRLHQKSTYTFQYNYPDSAGQLSYELRKLTNMRFYNQGIGGQTTYQLRTRFLRDALGFYSQAANDVLSTAGVRQTLLARPMGVVIVAGINDPFSSLMNEDETKANLEWMASQCQQYGVRAVFLNLPGDTITNLAQMRYIADINTWLNRGALSQYGAVVVDYNSWWNDPAYGNDNHHKNASRIADDIHPKNTTGGYDSLAAYIVAKANIPKLTKAVFINEISPDGFTGYSRPAGITINGDSYSLSKSSDTINITGFVPDSVWIKITSSTNVTGTTYTGFGNIQWFTDNNPAQAIYYTKRGQYQGSTKGDQFISSLIIQAPDFTHANGIDLRYADSTSALLISTGAFMRMILNGSTNPVALNSAQISIYGSASNFAISTQGKIKGAADSQFGNLEVGNTSTASTTGFGIGIISSAVRIDGSGGYNNNTNFSVGGWSANNSTGIGGNASSMLMNSVYNNFNGNNDSTYMLRIQPTLNNTTVNQPGEVFGGISYEPTITNQGGVKLRGFRNTYGDNFFNIYGNRTVFGINQVMGSALVEINGNKQGLLPPRMTTAQRDSIGYISSVTVSGGSYTIAPVATLSGGTGSGAKLICYISTGTNIKIDVIEPGVGYKTTSVPTVVLTGGTGSGATATAVVNGPDTGLTIYCTDCTATNSATGVLQTWDGTTWQNHW